MARNARARALLADAWRSSHRHSRTLASVSTGAGSMQFGGKQRSLSRPSKAARSTESSRSSDASQGTCASALSTAAGGAVKCASGAVLCCEHAGCIGLSALDCPGSSVAMAGGVAGGLVAMADGWPQLVCSSRR
eukprot:scaffold103723_cov63-Phaeocystis_antarctica.AAC.11